MAKFSTARNLTRSYEGGYNAGFDGSGETYAGIDRKYGAPNWPGWKIIDRIPNKQKYQLFDDPQLEMLVEEFYLNSLWKPSGIASIKDQALANMIWDFYFHKPAVAVAAANYVAQELDPTIAISKSRFSAGVLKLFNAEPAAMYEGVYNLRIKHYNNLWMNKIGKTVIKYTTTKKGLLNRAKKFPHPSRFMPKTMTHDSSFKDAFKIFW